jgi:thiol:disulfide interchange protein DsbD
MLSRFPRARNVALLIACALFLCRPGRAQDEESKVSGAVYAKRVGAEIRVAVVLDVLEGFHIYNEEGNLGGPEPVGFPTKLQFLAPGVVFEKPVFPTPHREEQIGLGPKNTDTWIWTHAGEVVIYARGAGPQEADLGQLVVKLGGQVCDDKSCDFWDLELEREDESAGSTVWSGWDKAMSASVVAAAPHPGSVPSAGPSLGGGAGKPSPGAGGDTGAAVVATPSDQLHVQEQSLGAFLLAAVFWGLFALLMPCTYPMIPITISFFTKQAQSKERSSLALSLVYGAGIVLIFVLIGVAFGSVIIPFATHPVTNLLIGTVFVVFAFSLFGAFTLEPPRFLLNIAGNASRSGGYLGVFLMGATLVVTSFTCTAPFVGSLLASGAQGGQLSRIVLGMATFGATMAIPFALLSLVPGRLKSLPRSGEWMHAVKVFLGFVELAAALKFLSNADLVWDWGILSRELFLFLWAAIFVAAALYLLGLVRLQGDPAEVSPLRMSIGVVTLLFATYCTYGALGNEVDPVMTALAPPYSNAHGVAGHASGAAAGANVDAQVAVIKDDYDAARTEALARGVPLLLNFTGHTCVNCRIMELKVFPKPEVAQRLRKVVEARLHTDGTMNRERILELQARFTKSKANPFYVMTDPRDESILSSLDHATVTDSQEFVDFLDAGLAAYR